MEERTYTFDTKSDMRYIVKVERYDYDIYAIKYYLKRHAKWKYKYNILTKRNDAIKVINTCLNISLCILKENPLASFGFTASTIYNPPTKKMEDRRNNKRYRVYSRKMAQYFSPESFAHEDDLERSNYLLLNLNNKTKNLKAKVEKTFSECYSTII